MADTDGEDFLRVVGPGTGAAPRSGPAPCDGLERADRELLTGLARKAIGYFADNQLPSGLVLDRQRNHEALEPGGLASTTATGMGLIALALATAPPYRLLSRRAAAARIRASLLMALELRHERGIVGHFVDPATGRPCGVDMLSTIDSSWLLAGALWAAEFLQDAQLQTLTARLYDRVDWNYWTTPEEPACRGLLRHGKGPDGRFLLSCWDRLNGETVFMYVMAAGAADGRAIPAASWQALRPFKGTVAGSTFGSADLGLFVFQYGLDLLDFRSWLAPSVDDLHAEATLATLANRRACQEQLDRFSTYRRFWGLSAGDGPGKWRGHDIYRCYSPAGPIDGTAHLMAALASVAHCPEAVLKNLGEAQHQPAVGGRYGYSNINLDRRWTSRDMVGIDAGAALLALDNYLHGDRVRQTFHGLPCVRRGLERLGFSQRTSRRAA